MEKAKIIHGNDTDMRNQFREDLSSLTRPLLYHANILRNDKTVYLRVQADDGTAIDPGFGSTNFTAPVSAGLIAKNSAEKFRFALHNEDLIDQLGKFFGLKDVKTGYVEFDRKVNIKTNDPEKLRMVFAGEATRKTFETMNGFNLHLDTEITNGEKNTSLELAISKDIVDPDELHKIYIAFMDVLDGCENNADIDPIMERR